MTQQKQQQGEHRDAGAVNPHEIPEGSERNPADVVNPESPYNKAKAAQEGEATKAEAAKAKE